MKQVSTIIWDWNGTLLDDIDICIESINKLLNDRSLPLLTKERYLDVFDFPVKDYYERIGFDFDKEPFDIPAHQYIELYYGKLNQSGLHKEAISVLDFFHNKKLTQVLLSASEQEKLNMATSKFEIADYFNTIAGLDNHYATSKTDIGKRLLNNLNSSIDEVCIIGDTTHDFEVANALGCKTILIANGHHSRKKLEATGAKVVPDLSELKQLF